MALIIVIIFISVIYLILVVKGYAGNHLWIENVWQADIYLFFAQICAFFFNGTHFPPFD